jgi:NitT/TauT family transport system substrate-binding protein
MGRLRWIAALAAAVAVTAGGCGDDDDGAGGGGASSEVTTVTVGTLPIANAAPMYLGMEKGYFKAENLVIKPQIGEGGGSLITSLLSNDSQFAFVGVIPAVTAVSKGLPIKAVAASDDAAATPREDWQVVMVGKGSDIRDVRDLEGKTIAVNALRGVAEVVIKTSLQKQGVDPASVKLLEVPFPEMPAALESGRVDAILASEPFLTGVLDAGGRQVDAPFVESRPKLPIGVYVATDQYIESNRDVVDRFSRAMNKSLDYAAENPDEVRRIIPTYTKVPKEVAARMRLPAFDSEIDEAGIELNAELTKRWRIIEKVPPVDDLVRD